MTTRHRIIDGVIIFPRRGDPPSESPLPGYKRDPNDQYKFIKKDCLHFYPTCDATSCCKQQINNCLLHGILDKERIRCKDCKDRKDE